MSISLYELEDALVRAHEAISDALERGEEIPTDALRVVDEYALAVGEKRDAVAAVIRRLDAEADYIGQEVARLRKKMDEREAAAERLKKYVLDTMLAHGIIKAKGKTTSFTVVKNPPSVELKDVGTIPSHYLRVVPESKVPDKRLLLEDLKDGLEVPGAELKDGGWRLQIR